MRALIQFSMLMIGLVLVGCGGQGSSISGSVDNPPPTQEPPAVPTALNAAPGDGKVVLTWTASAGATGYHVKGAMVSGGPYSQVGTPTGTTHTDTECTNGTTYYYVVSAVNAAGESGNSSEASATPVVSGTPIDLGTGLMTGKAEVPYSALVKPAKGLRVVDPDFPSTHLVRITDAKQDWKCAAAIPVYPTIQAWNADESLLILYVTNALGGDSQTGHALFDGRTYAFKQWLDINPADLEQFYWDTNNKDLLYYVDNYDDGGTMHFVFTRMNVSTGVKEPLHDFASDVVAGGKLSTCLGAERVSGGSDPFSMSLDNDLLGLGCYLGHNGPGGAAAFQAFTYRLSTGEIGQTFLTEAEVPQAAPSGVRTYFYQDDDLNQSWVMDPVTHAVQRTIAWSGVDHSDLLRNAAGHDIVAGAQYDGPAGSGNLMWADLTVGGVHTIIGEAADDGYPTPGTLTSGKAYQNPGWVAVGIVGEINQTSTYLDQEVLLANVDTGAFYRVAHHRSTGAFYNAADSNYWAQPNVTISPSGTRILVQSDWGCGTPGPIAKADPNAIVDTYVIELPCYTP